MEKKSMNNKNQDTQKQSNKADASSSDAADNATDPTETQPPAAETLPEDPVPDTPSTPSESETLSATVEPVAPSKKPDPVDPSIATEPTGDKQTKVSKLAILALLLALIALLVIGYGYTLIQKIHIQQSEQVSGLKEQLSNSDNSNRQLQQKNGQILGELNQVRTAVATQQKNVDELQTRLSKAMQQVSKLGTDTRKDWLLAEVEYLLRLANQRILMERTASGALSLLQGADQILKETDDVSIYPVRKALAQDMVALEAVPSVDIEGIFLKLTAINGQVDNLRLLPITDKHQLPDMLQKITPESMSQVGASWASAMDKLGSLIVIRHRGEAVTPLLSPEQHYFLTQNLHLMLEQTQQSLLQGKQEAYTAGLKKSAQWIETYFEASDATTQALLRGLHGLEGIKIAPSLPDISGSLRELKTYLRELHNLQGGAR
tara:strand:- start:7 stop:1305 length:1299 start_codon:yes stop_codon:yes gene_type:complete